MRKLFGKLASFAKSCRCRYCGYSGSDWPDSGECPSCGEVN